MISLVVLHFRRYVKVIPFGRRVSIIRVHNGSNFNALIAHRSFHEVILQSRHGYFSPPFLIFLTNVSTFILGLFQFQKNVFILSDASFIISSGTSNIVQGYTNLGIRSAFIMLSFPFSERLRHAHILVSL